MEAKITNRIVSVDDIIRIAELTHNYCMRYKQLAREEQQKKEEAQARQEYHQWKYIDSRVKYRVELNKHQNIEKVDDFEWFVNTLKTTNVAEITSVGVWFNASEDSKRESFNIDFYPSKIYYDSSNSNMSDSTLPQMIERYLDGLPERYDELIAKDSRRVTIPAMSVAIPLALVLMLVCLFVGKQNIFAPEIFTNKLILLGIFLVITFFGSLIIPTKNTSLYTRIKIETYYAGYDEKNYKAIRKNDYDDFKSKCEVSIGENAQLPQVRQQIEENYQKAKKKVKGEIVLAILVLVAMFILA